MQLGFLGTIDEIPAVLRATGHVVRVFSHGCSAEEARTLDLLIVAGWGHVLPLDVFGAPRLGTWNVHPSLLPAHRGADALRWAFLDGDERFGVTIHQMVRAVDAGPALWSTHVARTPLDTHVRMINTLMALAASALPTLLRDPPHAPQDVDVLLPAARPRVPHALQRLDPALDAVTLQRRIAAFDDRAPTLRLRGRAMSFSQSVCVNAPSGPPGLIFGVEGRRIAFHTGQGALLAIATHVEHGARVGDVFTASEGG